MIAIDDRDLRRRRARSKRTIIERALERHRSLVVGALEGERRSDRVVERRRTVDDRGVGRHRVDLPARRRRRAVDRSPDRGADLERMRTVADVGLERRRTAARCPAIELTCELTREIARVKHDPHMGLIGDRRRRLVDRRLRWQAMRCAVTAAAGEHRERRAEHHLARHAIPQKMHQTRRFMHRALTLSRCDRSTRMELIDRFVTGTALSSSIRSRNRIPESRSEHSPPRAPRKSPAGEVPENICFDEAQSGTTSSAADRETCRQASSCWIDMVLRSGGDRSSRR